MKMPVRRAIESLALLGAAAIPLAAQASRANAVPACADSTSVPYRDRVAVDLVYEGSNRNEMWIAIQWAGTSAARCLVSKASLPAADTSIYGVLQINALDDGGYEMATWLAGPRAPRSRCRNARVAITARDTPIIWGVVLAHAVPTFADCVLQTRGPAATPLR
jgi:hypothetical protein